MSAPGYAKCSCEHCGTHVEFPLELAENSIACPQCGELTLLSCAPGATAAAECPPAFEPGTIHGGPIPPAPTSGRYRLSLVLVAGMMLLTPLVYLGVVGALGYGLYYYATHGWSFFQGSGGRGRWLLYFAPLASGLAVFLFMLAPLFQRRPAPPQSLSLNPEAEPVLFDFIRRICEAVRAPLPARIDLDCQLNASAGFKRGPLHGREFVLTIGLPLVAALDQRQFAGILAHEFGHFTQGSAMRLCHLIRSIHLWLAQLVYARTAWDEACEESSAEGQADWGALLTRGLVGLARLPLRLTLFFGEAVSSLLMRQMEFDADRYEIEVAGSEGFAATARRLRVLQRALRRSYEALRGSFHQRRGIPDNFPAFLLHQESLLPASLKAKLERDLGGEEPELFATHPSDRDRVAQAKRLQAAGRFHGEGPAAMLFGNFEAVARQVTLLHYQEDLGLPALSGLLIPVEAIPAR